MSGYITKQVYTEVEVEVEVDVSLEDFSIKDIIEELQARDCPRQIIELLKRWNNQAISLTELMNGIIVK